MKKLLGFERTVYPFTTENISEYFDLLDLKEKSILTVGSSLDQALNAMLLGAGKITVYDLSKDTEDFYKLKREYILKYPREKLIEQILQIDQFPLNPDCQDPEMIMKMNLYLTNDKNYEQLRKCLEDPNISFVQGNIFEMSKSLTEQEKYDRIILSNVLQYLGCFSNQEDKYEFLKEHFEEWKKHLNEDGILQLLYLYQCRLQDIKKPTSYSQRNLKKIKDTLQGNPLEISFFPNCYKNTTDAIVTYTKKGR